MNTNVSSTSDARTGKRLFYFGWVILAVCCIFVTISYGIRLSFGVFFESLEQEFGWTRALTSSVFSVYMLLGSVFAILGGLATDRYGPKIVFMVTALFAFLGLLLTGRAVEPWHLFVNYSLLVAIGTGPTYVIATSTATRWFMKRRALALAITTSGVGLGSLFMVPVAAYFIASYGWRTAYLSQRFIAIIIMIPLSLLLKRAPPAPDLSVLQEPEAINHGSPGSAGHEPGDLSVAQAVRTKNFWLLIIIWFFYSFCLFMVMTHIVRYAIDLGITPLQAASIISISGLANIPARILMGLVSDRFGRKRVALACASLMVAALMWLTQSSSLGMLYVFAAVFGAAYGGLSPPTTAIIGDTFGISHIGAIFGVLEVGWMSGAAVGPAVAGYLFDTTGSYHLAFRLAVAASVVIVVLVLFLKVRPVKARKKEPV